MSVLVSEKIFTHTIILTNCEISRDVHSKLNNHTRGGIDTFCTSFNSLLNSLAMFKKQITKLREREREREREIMSYIYMYLHVQIYNVHAYLI